MSKLVTLKSEILHFFKRKLNKQVVITILNNLQYALIKQCVRFLTFLSHHKFDLNFLLKDRGVRVERKLAVHLTLVQAAVIQRDIVNADGEVLQVFAAIPPQTTLPRPRYLLRRAIIAEDLVNGEMSLLITPQAKRVH